MIEHGDYTNPERPLACTEDVNGVISLIQTNKSFEHAVNMGLVPGHSPIDKFGYNPLITSASDPEDIWEGSRLYTYDAADTAPIVSLASSEAADTQDIKITGLDIDGQEVEQTLTLTGTTRVALTTALWRVYRLENESATDLTGNVYCYIGTGTVPTAVTEPEVRAVIINGNNQTLMALYTVPAGKVGFLYRGEIGMQFAGSPGAGTQAAVLCYKSRRLGGAFKVKKVVTLINLGTSVFQDVRSFPDIVPALTDIRLCAETVSDDMGIWGTFDFLLVDEDQFTPAYLAAIGQPGY